MVKNNIVVELGGIDPLEFQNESGKVLEVELNVDVGSSLVVPKYSDKVLEAIDKSARRFLGQGDVEFFDLLFVHLFDDCGEITLHGGQVFAKFSLATLVFFNCLVD